MVLTLTLCLTSNDQTSPLLQHLLREDKGDIMVTGKRPRNSVPKIMKNYNPQWTAILKDSIFSQDCRKKNFNHFIIKMQFTTTDKASYGSRTCIVLNYNNSTCYSLRAYCVSGILDAVSFILFRTLKSNIGESSKLLSSVLTLFTLM